MTNLEHTRPRDFHCLSPDCSEYLNIVSINPVDRKLNAVIWPNDPECIECGQVMGRT